MTAAATTRRTALGAVGGGLAAGLTGCRFDPPDDPPAGSATAAPTTGSSGSPDPDRAAVDAAVATTTALLGLLADGGPALDPTGRLAAMHTAHLHVLTATEPTASPSVDPSTEPTLDPAGAGPKPARAARFRRRELAAQRQLAGLAAGAQSGALARLLACMSAAIAAHLAVLP